MNGVTGDVQDEREIEEMTAAMRSQPNESVITMPSGSGVTFDGGVGGRRLAVLSRTAHRLTVVAGHAIYAVAGALALFASWGADNAAAQWIAPACPSTG